MREDVDFGSIKIGNRISKPSLLKPGSEKIINVLGLTATFPSLKEYESKVIRGEMIDFILITCRLVTSKGDIVAEGGGARSVKQEKGDLNKALKMALKSAQIDATLRVAGLSDMYTQDIEDMPRDSFGNNDNSGRKELEWSEETRKQKLGFSKHKDIAWKDVDLGFLNWCINKEDLDEDIKKFCLAEKVHRASEEVKKQAEEDEINNGKGVSEPTLTEETRKKIENMKLHDSLTLTYINSLNKWLYSETKLPTEADGLKVVQKMIEQGVPDGWKPKKESDGDNLFDDALNRIKETTSPPTEQPGASYQFDVKGMIQCACDEWNLGQAGAVTKLNDVLPKKIMKGDTVIDKFDEQQCEQAIKGIMDGSITPF